MAFLRYSHSNAAGADVAEDDDAERVAVDFGGGGIVHLPCEEDFVGFDFGPGDGDDVFHCFAL
jgi:hypothetical protein